MTLRVVGAGLGRTGTMSLKLALERLLGAPCYHMAELFEHPEHVPLWHAAARGEAVDWHALFTGYAAAVDWPVGSFWREVSAAFPDALILLSTRSADSWWASASRTIFPVSAKAAGTAWHAMWMELAQRRFTPHLDDRAAAIAAFERHNADVRERAPKRRLLEWSVEDGWQPLCAALGVPVPEEPFPHANSTEEFLSQHGSPE
jgi:Sulfotransferase domain